MRKVLAGILVGAGLALTASAALADEHAGGAQGITRHQVTMPAETKSGLTARGMVAAAGAIPGSVVDHDAR